MKSLRWFLAIAWEYRWHLGLAFLLIPLVQGLRIIQPWFIQQAIDYAKSQPEMIQYYSMGLLLVIVFTHVFQYIQSYLIGLSGCRIVTRIRTEVFRHLLSLPYSWFQTMRSGQIVVRLSSDVEAMQAVLTGSLIRLISDTLAIAGILAMMFAINPGLSLMVILCLPLLMVLTSTIGRLMRVGYTKTKQMTSRLASDFSETLEGRAAILGYRCDQSTHEEFSARSRELTNAHHQLNRLEPTYFSLVEFFSSFLLVVILLYGAPQLAAEQLTFGELVAFIAYVHRVMTPIRHLSGFFSEVLNALTSMRRISELLQVLPERDPEEVAPLANSTAIEFANVTFGYGEEPVLKNMSFQVKQGETVAIVGRTGAGKSTIIRLLNRFYSPGSGRILIGGVDISTVAARDLRDSIGFVLQDVYLFDGSILQNLSLFEDGRNPECLRYMQDVKSEGLMPHADADSALRHQGQNLSTGERQLIAFGRVFQKDSAIFLLDEATSSLDMHTENFLKNRLGEFMRGKTAIIIAHRLATIRHADKILVLKAGEIAESGTYAELIARRGEFYEYFRNQYKDGLEGVVL